MKASELRIGNFVQENLFERTGKLKSFTEKKFTLKLPTSTMNAAFHFIAPIPLTEEWLKRFGFKSKWNDGGKQILRTEWTIKGLTIFFNTRNSDKKTACIWHDVGFDTNLRIRYVHQLQNLYYALTNEELAVSPISETSGNNE